MEIEFYSDGMPKFPPNVFCKEVYTKEELSLYWNEQMRLFDLYHPHFHAWCEKKTFGDPAGFEEFIEDLKRRRSEWFGGVKTYKTTKIVSQVIPDGKSAASGDDWAEEVYDGGEVEVVDYD